MVKPQQPELRRSDRGATSDDAAKRRLSAPNTPGTDAPGGRDVPEDNVPDLTQVEGDRVHDAPPPRARTTPVERALGLAGKSLGFGFAVVGAVISQARKRLPRR